MIQAARSGKQNIIEGSRASGTSKEIEIKLTNVARASLEEPLEDYRDFIRLRERKRCETNIKGALIGAGVAAAIHLLLNMYSNKRTRL